jgi:transglutaminase-like putative cysteine protease
MIRHIIFCVTAFTILWGGLSPAETIRTTWEGTGEFVYEAGFMHMLMRAPGSGVCLFNRVLVENDSPGVGVSEKGPNLDPIWGLNAGRKVFTLDDPRVKSAWITFMPMYAKAGKHPLLFSVNGNSIEYADAASKQTIDYYRWLEFPNQWLRKGKNTIDFSCPGAKTEEEGWFIFFARADDFPQGGGDPAHVGETSFKSTDGGKSWKESPFGPEGRVRGEYVLRLSLDRYGETGWLASPVIDLWKGAAKDIIIPLREIRKMQLSIRTEVPEGTTVEYFFRKGSNPSPFSADWSEYQSIGRGSTLDYETGGADLNRRYIQFKAVLSTREPLKTPVIRSARVTAELEQRVPVYRNIHVVNAENPEIRYSSIDFAWEPWNRPELRELRKRENMEEVVAGSRTEFEAQVRLLDYVTSRWHQSDAFPGYPAWNALSILDRIDQAGAGGYCTQFNLLLSAMFQSYGWPARQVNGGGHAVMEVWNNDYGKWVFMDAYTWETVTITMPRPLNRRACGNCTGRSSTIISPGASSNGAKTAVSNIGFWKGKRRRSSAVPATSTGERISPVFRTVRSSGS